MQTPPLPLAIAVVGAIEDVSGQDTSLPSVKGFTTYNLRRNNDLLEEREIRMKRCSSLSNLVKLSSELIQINDLLEEREILVKRSSSLASLSDLPSTFIQAGRVEDGFEEIVNNRLQKLPPSEKLDNNKLLEGALSIKPRDPFITTNLAGTQMVSNLSRTSSRPPTQGFTRITPNVNTRRSNFPSVNRSTIRREGSSRDPSRSFSNTGLSSQPLRSHPLRSEPPPSSMFGKWWSNCLCLCLPTDCFSEQTVSLPSYAQQSELPTQSISQQEMAKLVEKVFSSKFQTKCPEFQLMVTYDPVNQRLLFDGTILPYSDRDRFKSRAEKIINGTGWTQNLEELDLDHLVPEQLREVFMISSREKEIGRDTALCIFRDKTEHNHKTNRSDKIFMIANGNVDLKEVLKDFRERDVEGSSYFLQRAKAGEVLQTYADWNQKWQLLDSTTFADCINTAWLRQTEIIVERWREQWETTPYKAVVYWHRTAEHCSRNIKTVVHNFNLKIVESVESQRLLELLNEDVQTVCALGEGLRNTAGTTIKFYKHVEHGKIRLVNDFNDAALLMGRSELEFDIYEAMKDPSPIFFDLAINLLDKEKFANTQHKYIKLFRRPGAFKNIFENENPIAVSDDTVETSSQSDFGEASSQNDPGEASLLSDPGPSSFHG